MHQNSKPSGNRATPHSSAEPMADRLRELYRLKHSDHPNYASLYRAHLEAGSRLLGLPVGAVSRFEGDMCTVLAIRPDDMGVAAGDAIPLGDTYCTAVAAEKRSVGMHHVGADAAMRRHPVYQDTGWESYLAAPIWVRHEIYGTLSFTAVEPRQTPFSAEDHEFVELMADGLGSVIERDELDHEREHAATALRESTALLESAFQHAPIGMALVAPDGHWLKINAALPEIVGYSEQELLRIDFQTITHPEDLETDLELLRETLVGARSTYRMEKRYIHRDGHIVWVLLSVSLVRDGDDTPRYFVSQIQDISETKQASQHLARQRQELEAANRQLEALATTDPLTGLANRRAFDARIRDELNRSARCTLPVSLALIDIDFFKIFNDRFGHQAGDQALQRVAKTFQAIARETDLVARYGGEEFAAVLPNTDESGCRIMGKRLRAAVAAIADLPRGLTVSIGATTFQPSRNDHSAPTTDDLLRQADRALYRAKDEGRNRVRHYASMDESIVA